MNLSFKIWVLIIALLLSLLAIKPNFESGVIITSVERESFAFEQGLRQGQIIKSVNGEKVTAPQDYAAITSQYFLDGQEKRIDIKTKDNEFILFTNQTPEISVSKIPSTRIKTGLDLRGGARALVKPDADITDSQLQDLVDISRNRFNVYGLSDINVKGVSDLSGNKFMLIEIAGATPSDLKELIEKQGKFEAKIANKTVFEGGAGDISDVCRNNAKCAGIIGCTPTQGGEYCNFQFAIYLKEEAAQKHADITANLSLDETGRYLSEKLILFVDDKEVSNLSISSSLRGQVATEISIQGSGSGKTREEAINQAQIEMKNLQTILITGSIPYVLKIEKLDTISPNLGQDFVRLILIAGAAAILVVSIIIFARYRKFKLSMGILLTSFSELFIILGVAALIKWNLDLPSIAGILATIGTGVDQQIVIIDEAEHSKNLSIKERIKRASFVILSCYLTLLAAMAPLGWAGAGLFKGFAFTTILGVTIAILITRPAFADIVKTIEE